MDYLMFGLDALWEPFQRLQMLHGPWAWVLLFLPVLLLDVPRSALASLVVIAHRFGGWPHRELGRKQQFLSSRPGVSIIIAAYNEANSIEQTVQSVCELRYDLPNLQIIVVDDHSTDGTYDRVKSYAEKGEIILLRNSAASGRGGKPAAVNLGLGFATGDFLLVIDADSSFDRNLLLHMIGPFYDQRVGAVAGNIKVRNPRQSILTAVQAIEYLVVIGLNKRWLNVWGMNYIASGACGAYRRTALAPFISCDVETAEDLDNSLKVRRAGWILRFAPDAVCMTDVPDRLSSLARQRIRWDRDLIRVAMRKHSRALNPRHVGWRLALELWYQLLAAVAFNYLYLAYLIFLCFYDPYLIPLVIAFSWVLGLALIALPFLVSASLGERRREELSYAWGLLIYPVYSEVVLRWLRTWANTMELLKVGQEDSYLPQSAWRNSPRW